MAYMDHFADGLVDQETQKLVPFPIPTDPYRDVLMDFKFLTEQPNICPLCLVEDNLDDLGMYSESQREGLGLERMAEQEKDGYIRQEQRKTDLRLKRLWADELDRRAFEDSKEEPAVDYDAAYKAIFRGTTGKSLVTCPPR